MLRMRLKFASHVVDQAREQGQPIDPAEIIGAVSKSRPDRWPPRRAVIQQANAASSQRSQGKTGGQ
jgi:hypothetical protein